MANFSQTEGEPPLRIVVLMPVRDDWEAAAELTRRLDAAFSGGGSSAEVLFVDDGSLRRWTSARFPGLLASIRRIRVLRLRRNLGHQRAICVGLTYIVEHLTCDAVLVMDSDGEDTAEGARRLLDTFRTEGGARAIFAQRARRTEPLSFRISYVLYKALHRMLTGRRLQVGSFSVLPASYLAPMVTSPDLWNHYAAAVFRSRMAVGSVPISRGHRIAGKSQMNFVSLVIHGLSAIAASGEIVGVRVLLAALAGCFLAGVGLLSVVLTRFLTDQAIPGWATYTAGILSIMAIQFLTIASSFTFYVLADRAQAGFIPSRDCGVFIEGCEDLWPNA